MEPCQPSHQPQFWMEASFQEKELHASAGPHSNDRSNSLSCRSSKITLLEHLESLIRPVPRGNDLSSTLTFSPYLSTSIQMT